MINSISSIYSPILVAMSTGMVSMTIMMHRTCNQLQKTKIKFDLINRYSIDCYVVSDNHAFIKDTVYVIAR